MAYVYKHIRKDKNQIFYIGVGSDTLQKYKRANDKYKRNKIWEDIVRKAGYTVEVIIDGVSFHEARHIETVLIKHYGKICNHTGILSNITDGGEGCLGLKHTEETKMKLRLHATGKKSPLKGIKSHICGESHHMFGKTHSDELKEKWKITRKGVSPWNKGKVGFKMPNSQASRRKVVIQYDKNENIICEYISLEDAANKTGYRKGSICKAILGIDRMKSHKGYIWKYKEVDKCLPTSL